MLDFFFHIHTCKLNHQNQRDLASKISEHIFPSMKYDLFPFVYKWPSMEHLPLKYNPKLPRIFLGQALSFLNLQVCGMVVIV